MKEACSKSPASRLLHSNQAEAILGVSNPSQMKTLLFPLLAASAFLARPAHGQTQFEVLVVAVPEKWHRDCIPVAKESFQQMARHHQFGLTWAADAAVLDGDLKKFAAIVFLNTPARR